MKFSYETQNAFTYLVAELEQEMVDTLTLGMITNNHIKGLASVLYTEANGNRYLKYNVTAHTTAAQFFGSEMKKERILPAFQNILDAICLADDYMIDQNHFLLEKDKVFLNVSSSEVCLICLPTATKQDANAAVRDFFREILFNLHLSAGEDMNFFTQLIMYLNGNTFSVYGLRDLVSSLGKSRPDSAAFPAAVPAAQQSFGHPAPNLNATISIDQMPNKLGGTITAGGTPVSTPGFVQAQPQNNYVAPPIFQQHPAPPKPVPQPVMSAPRPEARSIPVPVPVPPVSGSPVRPMGENLDVPIPGKGSTHGLKPSVPPPPPAPSANGGEKVSFMKLMTHYNKENAAQYKAQKAETKALKAAHKAEEKAKKEAAKQAKRGIPSGPAMGVPATSPMPPVSGMQGGLYVDRPVAPAPVQNSFNPTVVLSAPVGATTVLSQPSAPMASLTRTKTGERAFIDKQVFRIGKEKNYVDYCVADNSAISRSHANIYQENGNFYIEDANSTNHTYLGGVMLAPGQKAQLHSGDLLRLANEEFVFTL